MPRRASASRPLPRAAAAFDEAFYFEPENAEGFSNLRFVLRRLNHLNGAMPVLGSDSPSANLPKRITTSKRLVSAWRIDACGRAMPRRANYRSDSAEAWNNLA